MTPWVQGLLFANVGVFFVQVMMPGIEGPFMFVPVYALTRPWTAITYMFLHGGFMHLLFNMIGLWVCGVRVEERIGSRRFAILYFVSGLTGALFSFVFAPRSPIIGASAGVFGVMLAFAIFWPRVQFFIWGILPVEARWLIVGSTVLAIYSGLGGSQGGVADFAHLGGYAGAFLYLRWIGSARGARRFKKRAIADVPEPVLTNWKKVDLGSIHELNRDEVNRILDKISADGVKSLTAEEKLFLSNFVPLDDRTPPVS